jgi:hypothetical protein
VCPEANLMLEDEIAKSTANPGCGPARPVGAASTSAVSASANTMTRETVIDGDRRRPLEQRYARFYPEPIGKLQ